MVPAFQLHMSRIDTQTPLPPALAALVRHPRTGANNAAVYQVDIGNTTPILSLLILPHPSGLLHRPGLTETQPSGQARLVLHQQAAGQTSVMLQLTLAAAA